MDTGRAARESLLRAAKAAREYEHVIEGRTFKMLMPTRHEARLTHHKNGGGGEGDATVWIKTQRDLLLGAIVGWSGVTQKDLLNDGSDNAVEFHADLVPLLLDARDLWFHELWFDLKGRYDKRDENIDEAKKNLETTSTV